MHQYVKPSDILSTHSFNSLPNLVELRIQQTQNGEELGL